MKRIVVCSVVLSILIMLLGCLPAVDYQLGAKVSAEDVMWHHGSADQDFRWEDRFLTISGTLEKTDEDCLLSGIVTFSIRSEAMYYQIAELKVLLFLLDQDDRIREAFIVINSNNHKPNEEIHFSQDLLKLGPVVSLAFGYDVSFVDDLGLIDRYRYYPQTDD